MTEPTRTEPTGFEGNQPQPPDLWARTASEKEAKKAVSGAPGWEREVLEKLLLGTLAEQRSTRRWRNFWRFGWLALIALIIWAAWQRDLTSTSKSAPHTAVVDIKGEIAAGAEASAEFVVAAMRSAFEDAGSQAVVLLINSPGGSPVQAGMINDEIVRLKAKHNKPLYAVVEET
ncbi:MAG TPA: S49 family peptidase, partial [Alicycliphilus sp.]|nr:S49 family peptidase [Alicycliphilus sp.]